MKNQVYWQRLHTGSTSTLSSHQNCDVAIVGGGMAGLSAAQRFIRAGKKIIILEQNFCGGGASGKSSGFITPDSELELSTLVENYGAQKAKKLWEFVIAGVNHIRNTIITHQLDCDFHIQNSLFLANSPKKFRKRVLAEYQARQQLGYPSKLYEPNQLPQILGSTAYAGGVCYPDTFGINSYLYCQGVKAALLKQGVSIYEQNPVAIDHNQIRVQDFQVSAKHILICTDRFLPQLGILKPHVYQAQTFLGLSKPLTQDTLSAIFPQEPMMVWDSDLIYQYYRIVENNRLLIGAASMLYTYLPMELTHPANVERIMRTYLSKKFPQLKVELEYFWPGLIGVSKDFLPVAAQDKVYKNMYYVGAATGLPWAAALGNYMAEKILSGRDDFDEDFNPYRKYPINARLQSLIRKPLTFALSHGIIKYFS